MTQKLFDEQQIILNEQEKPPKEDNPPDRTDFVKTKEGFYPLTDRLGLVRALAWKPNMDDALFLYIVDTQGNA